jgi:hypothetical protein
MPWNSVDMAQRCDLVAQSHFVEVLFRFSVGAKEVVDREWGCTRPGAWQVHDSSFVGLVFPMWHPRSTPTHTHTPNTHTSTNICEACTYHSLMRLPQDSHAHDDRHQPNTPSVRARSSGNERPVFNGAESSAAAALSSMPALPDVPCAATARHSVSTLCSVLPSCAGGFVPLFLLSKVYENVRRPQRQ